MVQRDRSVIRSSIALACSIFLHIGIAVVVVVIAGAPLQKAAPQANLIVFLKPTSKAPSDELTQASPQPQPVEMKANSPTELLAPVQGRIPIPDTWYYKSSEVDERAEPIQLAPLVYPKGYDTSRPQGSVKLRVFLDETGKIDDIQIAETILGDDFKEAAKQAILHSKFSPARRQGVNVKSQKLVEISFDKIEERPQQSTVSQDY